MHHFTLVLSEIYLYFPDIYIALLVSLKYIYLHHFDIYKQLYCLCRVVDVKHLPVLSMNDVIIFHYPRGFRRKVVDYVMLSVRACVLKLQYDRPTSRDVHNIFGIRIPPSGEGGHWVKKTFPLNSHVVYQVEAYYKERRMLAM